MRRLLVLAGAIGLCAGALSDAQAAGAAVTGATAATSQIDGSGSTWAQNAIQQWTSDVQSQNLAVVYTGSGSAQGRADFRNDFTDFAVSDIGFQGPSNGVNDTNCQDPTQPSTCRPYVYLPIVAGGTSFPYHIRVGRKLVRNLRLSGETLAKIFTNKITNWDNREITRDNNGRKLPSLRIIPVVHSEGSGPTAQFTRYLATEYPGIWRPFNYGMGTTEYFPLGRGNQVAENGSASVMNFVTSATANGAIGYDEYSYAQQKGWPVAQVENKAGYFVAPTQYNVAVALTRARINMDQSSPDYLLQNLNRVYTNRDKRAYPLSSYSYMIIPTSPTDPRMSTAKRQTLADFIDWSICGGQAEIGPLGYSPLPINLAQASFVQMDKLHTADPNVNIGQLTIAQCHNPTFWDGHLDRNHLTHIAPEPPRCDKAGHGPCRGSSGAGPGAVLGTTDGTVLGSSNGTGQTPVGSPAQHGRAGRSAG